MKSFIAFISFITLISCGTQTGNQQADMPSDKTGQIQPWSENPTYWEYDGNPVLLLGAFDHGHNPFIDGSTLDTIPVDDIDQIVSQIDEMVKAGGNLLRCVLDPGGGVNSGIDSYRKDESGKFDLNKPEGEYWDRLSTFISESKKRGVIVEIEIWDRFDWQSRNWEVSPFNPGNNVNYTYEETNLKDAYQRREIYHNHPMALGVPGRPSYDSASKEIKAKYDMVRKYQEKFVSKVYEVAKLHGNVLYNMNNETAENPAWGEYWIKYLKQKASEDQIEIVCTNMQDGVYDYENSIELRHQFQHPELYDYLDISQINSRLRDDGHWEAAKWIADQAREKGFLLHMIKLYGNDAREPEPWASWKPGDSDNAIEEWWQNLIAGIAGVRFHRPLSGIGLSEKAKACLTATRKIESKVKFWDVTPKMDLLSDRDFDEAYLAADPGNQYILYFSHQGAGSVGLDLSKYEGDQFNLYWVNIDTGNWGPETSIKGGSIQQIDRPDASAHWVAAITKSR